MPSTIPWRDAGVGRGFGCDAVGAGRGFAGLGQRREVVEADDADPADALAALADGAVGGDLGRGAVAARVIGAPPSPQHGVAGLGDQAVLWRPGVKRPSRV